jgi:hypothetical protein
VTISYSKGSKDIQHRRARVVTDDTGYTRICPNCGRTSGAAKRYVGRPRELSLVRCGDCPTYVTGEPKYGRATGRPVGRPVVELI